MLCSFFSILGYYASLHPVNFVLSFLYVMPNLSKNLLLLLLFVNAGIHPKDSFVMLRAIPLISSL